MNKELVKSLTELIDETLNELEDLKKSKLSKSERLSASEVKLGDDSSGVAGKDKNGDLETKKSEDEETDEEKEKKKKAAADMAKAEDKKEEKKDDKKDDDKKEDDKDEKKEFPFKKSLDDSEALLKSYVDSKISGLEGKMAEVLQAVSKLADAPVSPKGFTAKDVVPLVKSDSDVKTLSKSQVVDKLLELKKSGKEVDSADFTKLDLGMNVASIVEKYKL